MSIIQAITYSFVFYLAIVIINPLEFSVKSLIKSFFPISNNVWWFVTTYIGLYFIAPFLNAGMKSLEKFELFYVLFGLFILNCFSSFIFGGISECGYHLFNFIFIYLLGSFIRQNELKIKNPKLVLILSTILLSILGIILIYFKYNKLVGHLFYYNNPILILSAISLFFIFYNLKIEYNKFINLFAQAILGVYMIHDYPRIRVFLVEIVTMLNNNFNPFALVLLFILLVLSIFILCSIVELLRLKIYNFLFENIYNLSITRILKSRIKTFAFSCYKRFGH